MSIRGSVGSLIESHRAKGSRPDRKNFLPQPGQSDAKKATGVKTTDDADAYEHILTIQNAADLEFPATDPANAPPAPNSGWAFSRRIITSNQQRRRRPRPRHRSRENFLTRIIFNAKAQRREAKIYCKNSQ